MDTVVFLQSLKSSVDNNSLYIFLGSVGGGLIGAIVLFITWFIEKRNQIARELLLEALEIQAQKEAWILMGPNYASNRISPLKGQLDAKESKKKLYLQKVEIRAILDPSSWNKPNNADVFELIDSGRTWYIRDEVNKYDEQSYSTFVSETDLSSHPAIISSKGMEELCGWIERASSVWSPLPLPNNLLSSSALDMLKPLACAVCAEDRREIFGSRLSEKATKFLIWYDKKYNRKKQL